LGPSGPVADGTGIEGAWDFSLDYDAMASLYHRFPLVNRGLATPQGEASDPSGSVSFVDSLKQLGLKLEANKRPEPVLVIDHIEEKPAEN